MPIEPLATAGAIDVADWLLITAEQAVAQMEKCTGAPQDVHHSTPARGFPIVMPDK
jgi:hypothetical protein